MKTLLLLIFSLTASAFAQVPGCPANTRCVGLTWNDTNPAGTTFTIYRATGLCSGAPVFSKLATAVTTKSYVDSTVTPGNYCYTITAVFQGAESPQAAPVNPAVLPSAVTGLNYTVQ